tara:strand:- start:44 stop:337 length:294 start_codon:yes stop_codon:yes gene_type:complete
MSYLEKTSIPEIKWLLDLKQDLKLKLSSMLSSTEPETQKLELSLEELQEMAELLSNDFYETHLLLKVYENALLEQLGVVILQDLTDEDLELDQNMLH